jgi:tetratricopeptide (TPR) repeat protein
MLEVLSLRNQGRLREALALARELRARSGEHAPRGAAPTSALAEAQVLFDLGQHRSASALFDSISRREPPGLPPSVRAFLRVIALSQVATARALAGDTTSLAALADSIQHDGARTLLSRTRVQHEYVRGLLFAARGQDSLAERAFTSALEPGKTDYTWPSYELGKLLLKEQRPADAVRVLQPAVAGVLMETANFHLTLTELHERLAEAFAAAGQRDSAAVHYDWVVRALHRADPIWLGRRDAAQKRLQELKQN